MELSYWLYKTGVKKFEMARQMGVGYQTIYNVSEKIANPTISIALMIEHYTDGKVRISDLLTPDTTERLKLFCNIYPKRVFDHLFENVDECEKKELA